MVTDRGDNRFISRDAAKRRGLAGLCERGSTWLDELDRWRWQNIKKIKDELREGSDVELARY